MDESMITGPMLLQAGGRVKDLLTGENEEATNRLTGPGLIIAAQKMRRAARLPPSLACYLLSGVLTFPFAGHYNFRDCN